MKTIGKFGILLGLAAVFCYGEVWQAKVLDASCYDSRKATEHKSGENLARECAPTASTTDFAIQNSDGKVYKVNSSGSAELAKDMRDGVLKKDKDGDVHANITGSREGETVNVTSINIEKTVK
jgi:hypothetical protein